MESLQRNALKFLFGVVRYNLDPLQTLFKITAHPLTVGTLWVKSEPPWAKGRDGMFRTRYLRQTDRLISVGCPQSGALIFINYFNENQSFFSNCCNCLTMNISKIHMYASSANICKVWNWEPKSVINFCSFVLKKNYPLLMSCFFCLYVLGSPVKHLISLYFTMFRSSNLYTLISCKA